MSLASVPVAFPAPSSTMAEEDGQLAAPAHLTKRQPRWSRTPLWVLATGIALVRSAASSAPTAG